MAGAAKALDGGAASVPRFDDPLKAILAMVSNVLLTSIVLVIAGIEQLFGREQIPLVALVVFVLLELSLVIYYGAVVTSDKLQDLLRLLARAARTGVEVSEGVPPEPTSGLARRLLANLWVPVTVNFVLTAYLIYASGGIANSPYGPVPLAMMVIGQSLYDVPAIELESGSKTPRIVVFLLGVARIYAYPLCLMAVLLACLVVSQRHFPLVERPAPEVELAFTAFTALLASMCVTFITRKADQGSGVPARSAFAGPQPWDARRPRERRGAETRSEVRAGR